MGYSLGHFELGLSCNFDENAMDWWNAQEEGPMDGLNVVAEQQQVDLAGSRMEYLEEEPKGLDVEL